MVLKKHGKDLFFFVIGNQSTTKYSMSRFAGCLGV